MTRHRVVLCGYGRFGRVYAQRLQEHPAFELCGVVERASVIEEVWKDGLAGHCDFEEALNVHAPTLVLVATSEAWHASYAVQALSRHAHVMLAKPGGLSLHDALLVARVAAERRRNVFVDWTPLWMRGYGVLKEQAGLLGEWTTIRFSRRDWSVPRDCGVVWDLMPHDVAMMLDLVGSAEVIDVSATRWQDGAHATITYQNGLVVRIEADYAGSARDRSVEIISSTGYASWLADEQLVFSTLSDEPIEVVDEPDAITKHLDRVAAAEDGEDDLARYVAVLRILEAAHADLESKTARQRALCGLSVAA